MQEQDKDYHIIEINIQETIRMTKFIRYIKLNKPEIGYYINNKKQIKN